MAARIIDGKAIAAEVRADIAARVRAHVEAGGARPHLTAVLVGDDPASHTYVRNKRIACEEVGISSETTLLPASTSMVELLELIARLNAAPEVSGILVQTPLPPHMDEPAVMTALNPDKDVDGLHPMSLGRLVQGKPVMVPCTPAGVQEMLLRSGHDPAGKRVVIVGRSMLVGKPLALLLGNKAPGGNATVTLAHTATRDLASVTREAEILIVAAGRPEHRHGRHGAPRRGRHRCRHEPHRRARTQVRLTPHRRRRLRRRVPGRRGDQPVPGGVGPMTIAMLLANTLKAAGG